VTWTTDTRPSWISVRRRHYCRNRHQTVSAMAACVYRCSAVTGKGAFALLSCPARECHPGSGKGRLPCGELHRKCPATVALYVDRETAEIARAAVDAAGCGADCAGGPHQLQRLALSHFSHDEPDGCPCSHCRRNRQRRERQM
jgi:hypothetical protein